MVHISKPHFNIQKLTIVLEFVTKQKNKYVYLIICRGSEQGRDNIFRLSHLITEPPLKRAWLNITAIKALLLLLFSCRLYTRLIAVFQHRNTPKLQYALMNLLSKGYNEVLIGYMVTSNLYMATGIGV